MIYPFLFLSESATHTVISSDGNTTINAQYQIDASRNNGLDFQYDAVVRNRLERKYLNAEDCECCRDVSVCFINFRILLTNSFG